MKADDVGDIYATIRRDSIVRNNAKLNGKLPSVPPKGRRV
jgi:hypothetical protein